MEIEQLAKIQILMEEMPNMIESHGVIATYQKGKYDNYIEVGFNEEQALILCNTEPFNSDE